MSILGLPVMSKKILQHREKHWQIVVEILEEYIQTAGKEVWMDSAKRFHHHFCPTFCEPIHL